MKHPDSTNLEPADRACPVAALADEARVIVAAMMQDPSTSGSAGGHFDRLDAIEIAALRLQARSLCGALFQLHILVTRGERILTGSTQAVREAAEEEVSHGVRSVLGFLQPAPVEPFAAYYVGQVEPGAI